MNVTFTPAAHVLGVLPGGWVWLLVWLVVAFVVSRLALRGRPTNASANTLFALLAAAIIYSGFVRPDGDGLWAIAYIAFWIGLIVGGVLWVVDRFRGSSPGAWRAMRTASVVAVVSAVLLASNLSFSGWDVNFGGADNKVDKIGKAIQDQITKSQEEMKLDFTTSLNAVSDKKQDKIDTASYKSECTSLPNICKEIDALKDNDTKQDSAIKKLQDDVKKLQSQVGYLNRDTDVSAAADSLAKSLAQMGWQKGEVVTGDKIDWSKNRYDAGSQKFVEQSINTPAKYAAHLNGPSSSDKAARQITLDYTPSKYHAMFLRGENVVAVQFTKDSCVNGNTGWDGHAVVHFDKICHWAGDIWWVPVSPDDGTVYWAAATRADCGNPGAYVAPYPRNRPAPKVCPMGSDRPGKPITGECYIKHPKPPTTPRTPPTTTTKSCPPGTFWSTKWKECLQNKEGQKAPAPPAGRSPAGPPVGPKEDKPPTQSDPAKPSDKPGSGSTLPAPGSSSTPTQSAPAPTVTNAPSTDAPGTDDTDPDGH